MNTTHITLEQEAQQENTSPERLAQLAKMNETLAYLVAKNVNASPELLTQLTKNYNQTILKAILQNPNTPTETLIRLGSQFPEELEKNPILDLWLLEDNHPLLLYRNFNKQFASNPNTPINLLEILVKDSDHEVRSEIAYNLNTPISLLEILANDSNNKVRFAVALNANLPLNLLEKLATDQDAKIRFQVIKHPKITRELLETLEKDHKIWVSHLARQKMDTILTVGIST